MSIKSVCPKCKSILYQKIDVEKVCDVCSISYPIINGIESFVEDDEFYEGRFGISHISKFTDLLRRFYSKVAVSVDSYRNKHESFYRAFEKLSHNREVQVLDIGCGGGRQSLAKSNRIHITGVDLSIASLCNAKKIYSNAYRASIYELPFPDHSFDCICSFDVIGHIPHECKDMLLKELDRVLKPGGYMFHYIEIEYCKGYGKWAQKYPDLYKKYFIDCEGHIGLESYQRVIERFVIAGMSLQQHNVLAKVVWPPGEFSKRFANEYSRFNIFVKLYAVLDASLAKFKLTKAVYGVLLKPFQLFIEPIVSSEYGSLLYVLFKKD